MVSGKRSLRSRGIAWILLGVFGVGYWLFDGGEAFFTAGPDPGSPSLPAFTYTDQEGERFGSEDLRGKVWLADIIFTRCPDICSPMTANMARLQRRLAEEGLDVQMVSFSVDPIHDRPEVLKRYGRNLKVDFSNWTFLTHHSEPEMHQFLKSAFQTPIEKNTPESVDDELTIDHSAQIFLIDASGKIAGSYNGLRPDFEQVIRDVASLQGKAQTGISP
ncbi:SCO family protein [Paludifilum halophilum]|uniref:Thioredoxin domain-containing protein n=1 Tax=Paludifilum halophilum TaxID=1642702 RepID=A0A235B6D5_9BACL|nr:SCO family protein [Paludifilum halophilum]OYD07447.1 hypothetical protein CHM34_11125 [Paludifilum halophilum]